MYREELIMAKIENTNKRVSQRLSIVGHRGRNLFILTYDKTLNDSDDLFYVFDYNRKDKEKVAEIEKDNRYVTIIFNISGHDRIEDRNEMSVYEIIPTDEETAEKLLSPLDWDEVASINEEKFIEPLGYGSMYHAFTTIDIYEDWQDE